ncbi:DUF3048 domain-containing protein [Lentibacillus halophilus]|uniref:DUF3048 domain-containing protein n=1 Tax=Lentibacillus halophilus TaxID=295065 RepID=A0ABP3IW87_9BACI
MRRIFIFFGLVALFLTAACSSNDEQPAEDSEAKENATNQKAEASGALHTYPLTGVKTDQPVDNRMVGVMVNNHRKARPQTGISKADIVFEVLAEGTITRFLAMYQSETPDVVGPVRSAREYYFELTRGYGGLYIYHGAAHFVNDMIQNRGIEHLDGALHDNDGQLFKRASFRTAPHNSYLQFDGIDDAAQQKGYDMTRSYEPLPFASEEEAASINGDSAERVTIVYSNRPKNIVEYRYNAENGTYTRYSDGTKTVERNGETAITTDNIFIVETPHQVIDDAGRRQVDITSGGDAYLIQKGNVQNVQWENRDGRLIPVKDGDPVPFVPGQTWVNIVPSSPGMEQSVTISNE